MSSGPFSHDAAQFWYELFQRNQKWSRGKGKKSVPMTKNLFTVLHLREGCKNGCFRKFCKVFNKAKW